jgi:hypothetical protein
MLRARPLRVPFRREPPNIVDASFQALMDSVVQKLVKSGAPA